MCYGPILIKKSYIEPYANTNEGIAVSEAFKTMLLPRLITAVIGIPLVLLATYWGGIPFLVLTTGIVFLALHEYYMLAAHGGYQSHMKTGIVMGMLLFLSLFLNGTSMTALSENQGTVALLSIMLMPIFLVEMLKKQVERSIERLAITFFGAFFIPWALGHLLLLRNLRPGGMQYIYFLFIVIWVLDTGAYAIGIKWGKHRLAELISPKKSIEGAVGALVTGIIAAVACRYIFMKTLLTTVEAVYLGALIAIVGQFSDLAESLLKRDVNVKDSAQLLPGHGGMLDRFDSFLFTAPLLYYYLIIVKGV
jgi:phosphatidate cytidylyltransferase